MPQFTAYNSQHIWQMTTKMHGTGSSESKFTIAFEDEQPPKISSSVHMAVENTSQINNNNNNNIMDCICKPSEEQIKEFEKPSVSTELEDLLKKKEQDLREEYEKILEREKEFMKQRFEFILLNEQTRTSYMLREAHRERQEKIHALQTQLQCKNLAALMYVMCTERRRSRIEKLKIIRDYTNYIGVLQEILTQGQELILHLSRGYKTAARVDHEWREKMKSIVSQFMAFIYNYAGGDPETNQYLLDLPKLLATQAPLVDNPNENPCDIEQEDPEFLFPVREGYATPEEKFWWDDLDSENRPFIIYGDMADFEANRRREVLKQIRAQKTAPLVWQKYAFRDMFLTSECVHLDTIRDKYQLPVPVKWECGHALAPDHTEFNEEMIKRTSKASLAMDGKTRVPSLDVRGMGSILKIITAAPNGPPPGAKTALLGARDSMEITSTTKMRVRQSTQSPHKEVVLDIGKRRGRRKEKNLQRTSVFAEGGREESFEDLNQTPLTEKLSATHDYHTEDQSILGSVHNDSLHMRHQPHDIDDKIHYEKICPMDQCQRMQVDSFMRSLPPYMRANPFTHFEQTFEEYETCSPEQLEILKSRIEQKKRGEQKDLENEAEVEGSIADWDSTGVAVQTSNMELPPCTCDGHANVASKASSAFMFDVANLMPVKLAMDAVHRECFFDDRIDFDRFKLIGQVKDRDTKTEEKSLNLNFKNVRYEEIKEILTAHPSLLDIFQANAR